jgi:hypothetical protein
MTLIFFRTEGQACGYPNCIVFEVSGSELVVVINSDNLRKNLDDLSLGYQAVNNLDVSQVFILSYHNPYLCDQNKSF